MALDEVSHEIGRLHAQISSLQARDAHYKDMESRLYDLERSSFAYDTEIKEARRDIDQMANVVRSLQAQKQWLTGAAAAFACLSGMGGAIVSKFF